MDNCVCSLADEGAGTGDHYEWTPTTSLVEATDYVFMIAQGNDVAYSSPVSIGASPISPSGTATSEASQVATASLSKASHDPTASIPTASTSTPKSSSSSTATATAEHTSSSSVVITNPTPTSSWDAPREEDHSLTINDKIAIGIGVPIALLVLGTIGWWRAAKFFLHRKITGEPRLPMYAASKGSAPSMVIGSGLRPDTRRDRSAVPSLWGASSGGKSVRSRDPSPHPVGVEQVTVTPPTPVDAQPMWFDFPLPPRRTPSGLRQAWTPE